MPSCEKCWRDSRIAEFGGTESSSEMYRRLCRERTCTPEQQAGPDATRCEACDRMTRHQHCRICMACGSPDPRETDLLDHPRERGEGPAATDALPTNRRSP